MKRRWNPVRHPLMLLHLKRRPPGAPAPVVSELQGTILSSCHFPMPVQAMERGA